jgi:hypothetical protein
MDMIPVIVFCGILKAGGLTSGDEKKEAGSEESASR